MKISVDAQCAYNHKLNTTITIESPTKCPICNVAYAQYPLTAYYITDDSDYSGKFFLQYFCPHCESMFLATGDWETCSFDNSDIGDIDNIYPLPNVKTSFSANINSLSPDFVRIYNQAEKAEIHSLSDICGMAYRKSVEFLVKDYAIRNNTSDSNSIKSMSLSACIKKYIDQDRIKTLAERSVWIGNDETHYLRKHTNRDVSDLKKFIEALVYFIDMMLVTEDAESMTPIK